MAGGRLSDSEIVAWVNAATSKTNERAFGFEAMKALRDAGALNEVNIEKTLQALVADQDVYFTKYTAEHMERHIPEGIPRY